MANFDKMMKRLPDDIVEYTVFPVLPLDVGENEMLEFLQKQADSILAHFSSRLVGYIWQHEPFHLKPVLTSKDSMPPHLYGSTSFGDNIDDEWFIVSLLYDITREFAGTVVRVNDNDEEFLLIEAADALPKWLNPETAENRVFIYNGDLHVVPIPESKEEYTKFPMFTPTLSEALACVRDCTSQTRCSQGVQNLINNRLARFPEKCRENIHHTNCYLPTPLAALLDANPTLVSLGVRRFYYRDPLELKACRPMRRFKPDDLTRTRVKMTRCLYAQLVQQQFTPDRRGGWLVVAPSNPEFLERDIGVKLAHGFEILCSKCKDEDDSVMNEERLDSSNLQWQQFRQSLANKGYFRGEIEGSKLYTKLLNEAKQFYLSQVNANDENDGTDPGQLVLRRLKVLEPTFDEMRSSRRNLPPSDNDGWMNITPEQVDEMMKSASGHSQQAFDLSKIAESMSAFVEHESGIDGAEFPREAMGGGEGGQAGSGMIEAMQKLFDFPDDEESTGSDMSEYDWSDGSDSDELGSPSKMAPRRAKKSSLRKPASKDTTNTNSGTQNGEAAQNHHKAKSVRFSGPNTHPQTKTEALNSPRNNVSRTSPGKEAPEVPPRPSKLKTQPPVPPRPSNPPPATPPSRPARPPVLKKPNGVVKPSAPPPPPPPSTNGGRRDKKLEALMDAMDRELAATDVGKSFEREPKKTKPRRPARPPSSSTSRRGASRDIDDEDDDFRPVNVDLNVVKNTLESYKAQQGLPGPASNILAGFGLKVPDDENKT